MAPLIYPQTLKNSLKKTVSGDVVWGKHGRTWYPAKVVSKADVPLNLQKTLFRTTGDTLVVKWYGSEQYSKLKSVNVDHLAENKVDAARASRSHQMQLLYQQALADLRLD